MLIYIQRLIVSEKEKKAAKKIPRLGDPKLLAMKKVEIRSVSMDRDGMTNIPGIPIRKTKGMLNAGYKSRNW